MNRDSPSLTAIAVALARGAAALSGGEPDPIAKELLPRRYSLLLRGATPLVARSRRLSTALRYACLGTIDHVALRTVAIDREVERACEAGVDQLVVLGAGFDARAYRLEALRDSVVFEVDHRTTQAAKRERARRLTPCAREVRFVSVDFGRQSVAERLDREGHDASRPTLFIWEGVVMYLPEEATRNTLNQIHERASEGSTLAVTYAIGMRGAWLERVSAPVYRVFGAIGEPLIGMTTTADFHRLLEGTDWRVDEDAGPLEWVERFGFGRADLLGIRERLVRADRQ